MQTLNQKRLAELYKLYNKVTKTILGHPPEDRVDLNMLKSKVVQEIKDIESSLDNRLNTSV